MPRVLNSVWLTIESYGDLILLPGGQPKRRFCIYACATGNSNPAMFRVWVVEIDPIEKAKARLIRGKAIVNRINSRFIKRKWLIVQSGYIGRMGKSRGNVALKKAKKLVEKLQKEVDEHESRI